MLTKFSGLSAVMIISGFIEREPSIIAGNKLAVAVPDVVSTTTGLRLFLVSPNAKNALDLSSIWLKHSILE